MSLMGLFFPWWFLWRFLPADAGHGKTYHEIAVYLVYLGDHVCINLGIRRITFWCFSEVNYDKLISIFRRQQTLSYLELSLAP